MAIRSVSERNRPALEHLTENSSVEYFVNLVQTFQPCHIDFETNCKKIGQVKVVLLCDEPGNPIVKTANTAAIHLLKRKGDHIFLDVENPNSIQKELFVPPEEDYSDSDSEEEVPPPPRTPAENLFKFWGPVQGWQHLRNLPFQELQKIGLACQNQMDAIEDATKSAAECDPLSFALTLSQGCQVLNNSSQALNALAQKIKNKMLESWGVRQQTLVRDLLRDRKTFLQGPDCFPSCCPNVKDRASHHTFMVAPKNRFLKQGKIEEILQTSLKQLSYLILVPTPYPRQEVEWEMYDDFSDLPEEQNIEILHRSASAVVRELEKMVNLPSLSDHIREEDLE